MHPYLWSLKALWRRQDGATAIEYGLLVALISIACVSIWQATGTSLSTLFTTIAGDL